MTAPFPRRLAISAQVHPRILPFIHSSVPFRGPALQRLSVCAAMVGVGYAAANFINAQAIRSAAAAQDAHQEEERLENERLALLDAYGGRDSLEELEKAATLYSSQHRPNQL